MTGFICAGVSSVGGYKRNAWYNLSCLLLSYCDSSAEEKPWADSFGRPMA